MTTKTTEMSPALRDALRGLGWKPEKVTWGRRVCGNMHGAILERDGVETYYDGPFVPVRVGDQMAIVRWG